MINRRLMQLVPEGNKFVALNVLTKWISLLMVIIMISAVSMLIASLVEGTVTDEMIITTIVTAIVTIVVRAFCIYASYGFGNAASITVKKKLRETIFAKLLRLGIGYRDTASTSEIILMSVEGIDTLDAHYSKILPQLFYAILAPVTLAIIIGRYNVECAILLFIFVPIITTVLVLLRMWYKGKISEYWGRYTELGHLFLEGLQGMTTLKIYQSDGYMNDEINRKSEEFRETCKRSLKVQLGSITLMDLLAYGGMAVGILMAVTNLQEGAISLEGCLVIVFLSVEFFLPMRRLGSLLEMAMRGTSASEKIYKLLDTPEPEKKGKMFPLNVEITMRDVNYSYGEKKALKNINLEFNINSLTAIVGESGCGKSTFASVLSGRGRGYEGSITVGDTELSEINEGSLMRNITYVDHRSYLFKGTVRDNLLMGSPDSTDDELWKALEELKMDTFVRENGGLDAPVAEGAVNLSGGQRQRLAVARALLHNSAVYIFDECTSNVDRESENIILDRIEELSYHRIVILISHRLANAVRCQRILVMDDGAIVEEGTHDELLSKHGVYENVWKVQKELESYGKEVSE